MIECATQVCVASSGAQTEPIFPEEPTIANGKFGMGHLSTMQTLTVNGQEREFPHGVPGSLEDLVLQLAVTNSAVVAEVDGVVINQDAFARTELRDGQTVELIRFVGGGSEHVR